jgi:regulatory protein
MALRRATPPVHLDPEEARQAAYVTALRLLAGRDMATARLRDRLAARGFPAEAIDESVIRLTGIGALDDRRAAHVAARTLVTVRLRGRYRVGRELERLGFGHDEIEEALHDVVDDDAESGALARVVRAKLQGRPIPDAAAYRRLFASLLRRGFPAGRIRAALRPFWRRSGEAPAPDD